MKYKLIINIINHHLETDELNETIELTNQYKDTSYHQDYSKTGGEGYFDMTAELIQLGRNLKIELVYTGEGKSFEERHNKIKHAVESGELQRSLLYDCVADINIPGAKKKADKITATITRIG